MCIQYGYCGPYGLQQCKGNFFQSRAGQAPFSISFRFSFFFWAQPLSDHGTPSWMSSLGCFSVRPLMWRTHTPKTGCFETRGDTTCAKDMLFSLVSSHPTSKMTISQNYQNITFKHIRHDATFYWLLKWLVVSPSPPLIFQELAVWWESKPCSSLLFQGDATHVQKWQFWNGIW